MLFAILLWRGGGFLWHIAEVVAVLIVIFKCVPTEPRVYESKENELEQKLEIQNNELQALQEKLSAAQENKKIDVSIEELEYFILTGNSSARSAEELYEKYSALEKPKEKTGYDVWWTYGDGYGCRNRICKYGGYFVSIDGQHGHQYAAISLPQLVLTKSTKAQSDVLLKFANGEDMKLLREISDDRMHTLLFFCPKLNVDESINMVMELTGKARYEWEGDSSARQWMDFFLYNDPKKARVIARSKDKEKLLDYAAQFAVMNVHVKVI